MRARLGGLVDSESVRAYQAIVYAGFLLAGLQTIWLGAPPTVVAQAMGDPVEKMWLALLIGCPLLTGLGYWARCRPGGMWLLVAGDAGTACATAAYVAAVLQATWAERASFALWNATSLTVCAVIILVRDLRRIRAVSRLVKEAEHE